MTPQGDQFARLEDAGRVADHGEHRDEMKPGDEAPPGDALAGENLCRVCSGSGTVDGRPCASCAGTGTTTSIISGGP
jgi:DnaJ-class molecular chaperone